MNGYDPKDREIEDLKKEVLKYKDKAEFYKKMFERVIEDFNNFIKSLQGDN